jgi:CHAT domain-containing protein
VGPGKLGVVLAREPAPEAVASRRKADAQVAAAVRGKDWADLPGTRVEVSRLAKLFGDRATVRTDAAASERALDELRAAGRLTGFRYLHLATHGEVDDARAFESALILSRDPAAGPDGRLTANEVLEHWKLDAELVTLSACETALGRPAGGDGRLGFAQAFLLAGSRSVCLSLWKVDDAATALLMDRFYQNLLGKRAGLDRPVPKAEALAEAKRWLRELTADEAVKLAADLTQGVARGDRGKEKALPLLPAVPESPAADPKARRPYAHPRYWAAFVLIGDPE